MAEKTKTEFIAQIFRPTTEELFDDIEKRYEEVEDLKTEGEWIQKEFWPDGGTWRCSKCERQVMFLHGTVVTENMNYCPGCGSKMKGGAE